MILFSVASLPSCSFFFLFDCVFRSVLTLFTWKPLSAHWVPVASGLNFTWTWPGNLSTRHSYAFHSNAISLDTIEWVSNAPTGFSTSAHIHNGGRFQSSDMRMNETTILSRCWRPHNFKQLHASLPLTLTRHTPTIGNRTEPSALSRQWPTRSWLRLSV